MDPHRRSIESHDESTEHAPAAVDWTLVLWVAASFLGALVGTHYVLAMVLLPG
jgi:hypothetical protein